MARIQAQTNMRRSAPEAAAFMFLPGMPLLKPGIVLRSRHVKQEDAAWLECPMYGAQQFRSIRGHQCAIVTQIMVAASNAPSKDMSR